MEEKRLLHSKVNSAYRTLVHTDVDSAHRTEHLYTLRPTVHTETNIHRVLSAVNSAHSTKLLHSEVNSAQRTEHLFTAVGN